MIINSYMSTVAQIENNNIFYKQFPLVVERFDLSVGWGRNLVHSTMHKLVE